MNTQKVITKKRFKSKTNIFNAAMITDGILQLLIAYLIEALDLPTLLPLLEFLSPASIDPFLIIIIGAIGLVLREMTKDPIEGSVFEHQAKLNGKDKSPE